MSADAVPMPRYGLPANEAGKLYLARARRRRITEGHLTPTQAAHRARWVRAMAEQFTPEMATPDEWERDA